MEDQKRGPQMGKTSWWWNLVVMILRDDGQAQSRSSKRKAMLVAKQNLAIFQLY